MTSDRQTTQKAAGYILHVSAFVHVFEDTEFSIIKLHIKPRVTQDMIYDF